MEEESKPVAFGEDGLSEEESHARDVLYNNITVIFNSISIILALSAFVAALFIHGINKNKSGNKRRLSLRLVMGIAFSDACFSAAQIHGLFLEPGFFCTFSTWGFLFFLLLSQFFTCCIALNLFLVLVLEKTLPEYVEYLYFGGSILGSLIITLLPVIFGIVGFDEQAVSCWFIDQENINTVIWEMCSLYGWALLSVIFCFLMVAFIVYKLKTRFSPNVDKNSRNIHEQSFVSLAKLQKRLINRTVGRIALYPLVPSISLLLNLSNLIYLLIKSHNPFYFQVAGTILYSSHGIVTTILFLFDPTVSAAITSRKFQMITQHFPSLVHSDSSSFLSSQSLFGQNRAFRSSTTHQLPSNSSTAGLPSAYPIFSSIWITYHFILTAEQRNALRNDEQSSCKLGDEYFMDSVTEFELDDDRKSEISQGSKSHINSTFVASVNFRRLSNDIAIPPEHMKKFMKSL